MISTLPGSDLRTHVESLGKPRDGNKRLKALACKLDIKRHSPRILYFRVGRSQQYFIKVNIKSCVYLLHGKCVPQWPVSYFFKFEGPRYVYCDKGTFAFKIPMFEKNKYSMMTDSQKSSLSGRTNMFNPKSATYNLQQTTIQILLLFQK